MFNLLLNTMNGFFDTFSGISFKGSSIFLWCVFPFICMLVIRFLLPLFRMNLNPGSLVSPVRRSITSDVGRRR